MITINYDAKTGDVIEFNLTNDTRRQTAKVLDTSPNGVRVDYDRDRTFYFTYAELQERNATRSEVN